MKRWIVLLLILMASGAYGDGRKGSEDGRKTQSAAYEPLQRMWNSDAALIRFDESENAIFYGVKGTVEISKTNASLRSGWIAVLYKPAERKTRNHVSGSYYSVQNWNFNCKKGRLNIDAAIFFNEQGIEVASFTDNKEWEETLPGSVSELIASVICSIDAGEAPPAETDGEGADGVNGVSL